LSNYTKTTNFTIKDSLLTGNPSKKVQGSELDTEFTNIATAVATKLDTSTAASTYATQASLTTTNTNLTNLTNTLDAGKADIAGETYSGTHNFTGATVNVATASVGSSGAAAASLDFVNNKAFAATASIYTYTTTAVSKAIAAGEDCLVTAASVTITLPASPTEGALCFVGTASGVVDTIISGNGNNIIGDSTLVMDIANRYVTLEFRTGYGWRVK
jgi:hypothetical protein